MIRAVLFDVDGVLMDSFEANYTFYNTVYQKMGETFPSREVYREIVHMSMHNVFRSTLPSRAEQAMIIAQDTPRPIHLFIKPDQADVILESLRKKYTLGIVTSRVEKGIDAYFSFAKNRELFSTVIHHGLYEEPKPSPVPLLLAAKQIGIPCEEIIYVGDTLSDMQAALAAGMQFVLYGREETAHHAESFVSLEKVIEDIDAQTSAQDS